MWGSKRANKKSYPQENKFFSEPQGIEIFSLISYFIERNLYRILLLKGKRRKLFFSILCFSLYC